MIATHALSIASALLLPPMLLAQADKHSPVAPSPATTQWQQGIGTEPVPGRLPGTHSYNVTFRARSFDLKAFKAANDNKESPAVVAAIVEDLQERARRDQHEFRLAVEALGGAVNIHFWLINACNIDLPAERVELIRGMPNVLYVHADLPTYPATVDAVPFIRTATNSSHHNADAEHTRGNRGTGFGVAIVDTSADTSLHGANMPHMVFYRNADRNNHTGGGLDGSRLLGAFALAAQPANNSHPHGTGVSGIAAGAGWSTATADAGHASDAPIVMYSICNSAGSCGSTLAIEAAAWQRVAADAVMFGLVTGNMSYGSSPNPLDVSQQAIDACALNANVLPITSGGNGGTSTAGSSSTANGIAVAAVSNAKVVAGFSSRGPLSGDPTRFFPDISGCGVATVMPQYGNEGTDWIADGTSMASPQVCGAAALIKSARPASNHREIKALLLNNTESIAPQNPTLNRNAYGMGFLRDDIACSAARANQVFSSTINSTTTPNTHAMAVSLNQIYAVTLVWNRHTLTSTAWSDLTLTIRNGAAVLASSATPRNLYERVEFSAPITGNVTIEVSAASLEIANLPYSVAFGLSSSNGLAAVTKSGTGCVAGSSTFYELFSANTFDLAPNAIRLTPQAGGYRVTQPSTTLVPPTGTGLGLTDDSLAPTTNLPFTLAYPGGSTNQIRICSNGFIYLNGTGSSASFTPTVQDALTGGPRLFPAWTDLLPDGATNTNNVFYDVDAPNNRVLITWRNVPEFGQTGTSNTLQVVINSNGVIDYVWSQIQVRGHETLTAFSPGNSGRDPGNRDISSTLPFSTGADSRPLDQDATRPIIGTTCNLLVSDIRAGSLGGVELIGTRVPGIDLTFFDMPECFLYLNPILLTLPFATPGSSATIPLIIANNIALTGAALPVQAATISPGLNPRGIATSNLCTLTVGQF
jgi:subtilisin family serine protease